MNWFSNELKSKYNKLVIVINDIFLWGFSKKHRFDIFIASLFNCHTFRVAILLKHEYECRPCVYAERSKRSETAVFVRWHIRYDWQYISCWPSSIFMNIVLSMRVWQTYIEWMSCAYVHFNIIIELQCTLDVDIDK